MRYCPECTRDVSGEAARCPDCGAALAALSEDYTSGVAPDAGTAELERLREELSATLAPQYELLNLLGRGGMGLVFLAWEPALERQVAVKVVSPERAADHASRAAFIREARAGAAISHPNVVRVFTVGETAERHLPYMIMQYVKGTTLRGWVERKGRVSEREARRILGEVAAALDAAHGRRLVHRDVKPGNIMIEDESGRAYVADFGITAALAEGERGESVDGEGAIVGTPAYMNPEQAGGESAVPKSDVYSLGMVAYELITGERPFAARQFLGWVTAHLVETPPPLGERRADISPDVARLVDRCLAKRPEDRPEAHEVARGMLPTVESEIEWPPPGLGRLHRRGRVLTWVTLGSAVAGLLVLFTLAFPPEIVRLDGDWWERFEPARDVSGSALGVRAEAPDEEGAAVSALFHIWRGALILGYVGLAVSLVTLAVLSFRTLAQCLRQRRVGWRWSTLLDVTADPDGRNGLLLAGVREFASLEEPRRSDILRARRSLAGATLGAGLWAVVALALWAGAVTLGFVSLGGAGPVAGLAILLLVLFPAGVTAAAAVIAGRRECRLIRPLARRRDYSGTVAAGPAESGDEEVRAWHATLPDAPPPLPSPSRWPRLAVSMAWLAGAALSVIGLLGLAVIVAAVLVAAENVVRWGPKTAELATMIERVGAQDPLGAAQRIWQPYLPLPQPVDSVTAVEWGRALMSDDAATEVIPAYSDQQISLVRLGALSFSSGSPAAQRALAPDTVAMLEELAGHPRTALFRRLSRASRLDLLGAVLDRSPAEYPTLGTLPQPAYPRLREAASANAWAALLMVSRGELDSAVVRLGENAAFAEHLLFRTPSWFANHFGALMLRDYALLPLASLEEIRGHTEKAQKLGGIADEVCDHVGSAVWSTRMAGLAANPEESARFLSALTDRRLLLGVRVDAFDGGWKGFCANPREILSGVSLVRSELVRTSAGTMHDMPYSQELAQLTESTWMRSAVDAGSPTGGLLVKESGPLGVLSRLRFCRIR